MQVGGAVGRVQAKEQANPQRERESQQDGRGRYKRVDQSQRAHGLGNADAQQDAKDSAQQAEGHCLHQELEQDMVLSRANRFTQADFARALADRDQGDIHNPNPAHQQRDGGNCAKEGGQGGGDGAERFEHVALALDAEVGLGARFDFVLAAHDEVDLGCDRIDCLGRGRRYRDGADRFLPVADGVCAEQFEITSLERNQHDVIRVAEAGTALGFENANHCEAHIVDFDRLTDGFAVWEQFPGGGCAQHSHLFVVLAVVGGEEASALHFVGIDLQVIFARAGHRNAVTVVFKDNRAAGLVDGRNPGNIGQGSI